MGKDKDRGLSHGVKKTAPTAQPLPSNHQPKTGIQTNG